MVHSTPDWYNMIYDENQYIHESFKEWIKEKHLDSVFEIGAGIGHYSDFFKDKRYTGIDMNPFLKTTNPNHFTMIGDVMKFTGNEKYDLVFSHSVIDHVENPELFIKKCLDLSKKYVYITAYNGHFIEKEEHEIIWNGGVSCYFNNLSINKLKEYLKNYKHKIVKLNSDKRDSTVIIIEK